MVQCVRFDNCQDQVQRKRQRRAGFPYSINLIERIVLLIGIFLVLDDKIMTPCTFALALSSRSTDTSPFSSINAREFGPSSGRIRNCGCDWRCTIIQPSGIQNLFHTKPYHRLNTALCSTTEKSTNGGLPAATILSSSKSPAVVTTAFNVTNTAKTSDKNLPKNTKDNNNKYSIKVPRHVGLICDGNGRWATQRNLPRAAGHLEGARRLVDLIKSILKERNNASDDAQFVNCITLYAFSTENWNRSPLEITKIFEAIEFAASAVQKSVELKKIDLKILGDLSDDRIPVSLKNILAKLEKETKSFQSKENASDRLQVCLAINYGGRRDIVSACRSLAQDLREGRIDSLEDITEDALQQRLSTGEIDPPDLIVRTGGEHRLSNFLLWESAYAELCVSQVLWPDFSWEGEWKKSLEWYSKRKRNFGGRQE